MIEFSGTAYLWFKVFHIISVIAWMSGLLYLPRLFVYHTGCKLGSDISETFKIMEKRLLRAIMTPAMIGSWIFGGLLIFGLGETVWEEGWLLAKLVFVVALTAMHIMMARWRRDFAEDNNKRSEKFYRVANEVPTLLMIAIVIFVVVQPF